MLPVLQFIFQDFWHWLGSFLILAVIIGGIANIFEKPTINVNQDTSKVEHKEDTTSK